jgi:hypothetical protein
MSSSGNNNINLGWRFYNATPSGERAPKPAFHSQNYYQSMRQRELQGYNSLIESIVAHHPTAVPVKEEYLGEGDDEQEQQQQQRRYQQLPAEVRITFDDFTRRQQRLVEDYEEENKIPMGMRATTIERACASIELRAVRESGVAERRPTGFDGVTDQDPWLGVEKKSNVSSDTDDDGGEIGSRLGNMPAALKQEAGARRDRDNKAKGGKGGKGKGNTVAAAEPSGPAPVPVLTGSDLANFIKTDAETLAILHQLVQCEDSMKRSQLQADVQKMKAKVQGIRKRASEIAGSV